MALRTRINITLRSRGFSMKSKAPILTHSTAVCTLPCPDIIITGKVRLSSAVTFSRNSRPSIPSIFMSQITNPYLFLRTISSPSAPFAAVSTLYPSYSSASLSVFLITRSSSMTRILSIIENNYYICIIFV